MTKPENRLNERNRDRLLADLEALNNDLARHGVEPLVTIAAGRALQVENLRRAVKATGDHLVDVTHKLGGF